MRRNRVTRQKVFINIICETYTPQYINEKKRIEHKGQNSELAYSNIINCQCNINKSMQPHTLRHNLGKSCLHDSVLLQENCPYLCNCNV